MSMITTCEIPSYFIGLVGLWAVSMEHGKVVEHIPKYGVSEKGFNPFHCRN